MNLVWIGWRIEYPFGGVKGVCDDNYVIDVGDCYEYSDTNNFLFFYFILFYFIFSDFTFLFLYFIGKTMKKARDKEVTWQVTWCDVMGLEPGRRI